MRLRLGQILGCAAVAAIAASAPLAQAAGPDAAAPSGRDIAANCAACHGTDGRSRGAIPSLAGTEAASIVQAMKDFRDGRRASTVMGQLSKGYTDAQIESAAAYFAAQPKP